MFVTILEIQEIKLWRWLPAVIISSANGAFKRLEVRVTLGSVHVAFLFCVSFFNDGQCLAKSNEVSKLFHAYL